MMIVATIAEGTFRSRNKFKLTPLTGLLSCARSASLNSWRLKMTDNVMPPAAPKYATENAKLLAALKLAKPYVERAYECAFPDAAENASILAEIEALIAKAA